MYFLICILFSISSFFSTYNIETMNAINYFNKHAVVNKTLERYLTTENVIRAKSIVAPEVAMYSMVEDVIEYRTLFLFYIQFGSADFSIGKFQMKPSFAEEIEKIVIKKFGAKYRILKIRSKNNKEIRKIRLDRLMNVNWQCIYLSAFIDIASEISKKRHINKDYEVRYWATLYNSGINSSHSYIIKSMKKKQFPMSRQFNYAEVVQEFYDYFKCKSAQ